MRDKKLKMEKLGNIHPGMVLREDFLAPMKISGVRLAREIFVPPAQVGTLLRGKRAISADMAIRLGQFFGNHPRFWLGLQIDFDLEEVLGKKAAQLDAIKPYHQQGLGA